MMPGETAFPGNFFAPGLGPGLVLGFSLSPGRRPGFAGGGGGSSGRKTFSPNAFLRVGGNGLVTVILGKSEMGQGVYTSLAMLVAEELEADWQRVRVESAPVDPVYNHTAFGSQMTGGSSSVWSSSDQLRRAGAAARTMLIAAAAKTWRVPAADCKAERGSVVHGASGRRLSFGELADRAAAMPVPSRVKLKQAGDFRIIGRPMRRIDSPEKVTGAAAFGMDVRLPGLLTAVIARPPVFGARLKGFDDGKARAVPGVKAVFAVDAGVAVAATGFWQAKKGRDALAVEWDPGPRKNFSTDSLRDEYAQLAQKDGAVAVRTGNPEEALAGAAARCEAVYEVPYLAHAPMEPLNCTVNLKADSCEIWTGTQFQSGDRETAARRLGFRPEQVQIHTLFLGGGFGRRANPVADFVSDGVEVAKVLKVPVKVVWTREDDIRGGYYRPQSLSRLAAGLDREGRPVVWTNRIVVQSILAGTPFEATMVEEGIDATSVEGAADIPYAVPSMRVDLHSPSPGVPVLWWRSVGHSGNAFVTESFIDELAHLAGRDPFTYRRDLLVDHPRHRRVLELAAEKADWGGTLPAGVGRGIALHESFKSIVAQVAEVSVGKTGTVKVHRVVCAVDCGAVVNPLTVEAQMEGGIAFGLGAALYSAVTFKEGRVEQSNFSDYKVARLPDMPRVEVSIAASEEEQGGIGEPGVPPIAPAVTNAIFAVTGKRIRRLPINPAELKAED